MDEALSKTASNACIYTTLSIFLIIGVAVGIYYRKKGEFYAGVSNRTGLPLALNFLATGLGSSILTTYPQAAILSGLHGCLVYAATTALPIFAFSFLGPKLRRARPDGIVLTEWVRGRYGTSCGAVFSACTILTIYLFACSELSNLRYGIRSLTRLDGQLPLYIEPLTVAIYIAMGGFSTSFFTDNVQSTVFLVLAAVAAVAMGVHFHIDEHVVHNSPLLKPTTMGWKMLYILMVESLTNDMLLSGFWLRTFAAKDTKQLLIGSTVAALMLFLLCTLSGCAGLVAVWSDIIHLDSPTLTDDSQYAFFDVLLPMPAWVQGFALALLMTLSCCTFDSYSSSLVTTISNDVFRNKVRLIHMRILTFIIMVPIVALALRSPNILSLCDLVGAAIVPVLFLGLWDRFYWLSGFEVIHALFGGILCVYIFGDIYYQNGEGGFRLLLLEDGIYGNDWGVFGMFVAAPVGSYIGAFIALVVRGLYLWWRTGRWKAVFDRGRPHWDWRLDAYWRVHIYDRKHGKIFNALVWFFFVPPKELEKEYQVGVKQYTLDESEMWSLMSDSYVSRMERQRYQKKHFPEFKGLRPARTY